MKDYTILRKAIKIQVFVKIHTEIQNVVSCQVKQIYNSAHWGLVKSRCAMDLVNSGWGKGLLRGGVWGDGVEGWRGGGSYFQY